MADPLEPFAIPREIRSFAEQSVEQARQAFDGFITATQQAVSSFEGRAAAAQAGARDASHKIVSFAEQNVASAFEFAQQLVRAKNADEMLQLQADYIRRQMQTLAEQAKELGQAPGDAARNARKS